MTSPLPGPEIQQDDPETWDEDRLREELTELHRAHQSAAYERDKYDRRRKAYASAIAPIVRAAEATDEGVLVPQAVWDGFTSDLAQISFGRVPEPRT